ncbi:MAG: hypothetical protein LBD55_12755 [Treponema sp.]|jgi:hypothetical protein|nr:hypothetical protein [Treponema sp.]
MIFHCHVMRQLFLNILKRAKHKYGFSVHNFCIMGSHIHLDYVSQNPVKAQLVNHAEDWEFGGIRHFIARKQKILVYLDILDNAYCRYCYLFR